MPRITHREHRTGAPMRKVVDTRPGPGLGTTEILDCGHTFHAGRQRDKRRCVACRDDARRGQGGGR
jgi:hypothetical protein